ncbi:hypothetical protein KI440_03385 [Candidatus Saccharibacteria bacterium TM7i]|nr:hypothetical protein KI440_03385 [Candidatus Saccharibacteria bacterium TM7i]
MNPERPDFMRAFEAVEVPPTVVLQDAIEASALQEAYLSNIQNSLDLSPRTLAYFFEYETKLLLPSAKEEALRRGETGIMTDDYITLFRRRGHQVLASVMLIRDDFNYSVVHFAKHPITEWAAESIRELQLLERLEAGLEE